MKIYLAGPWVRRPEVREIAARLTAAGHTLTSRWLYEHHGDPNDSSGHLSHTDYIRLQAREDIDDILRADVFVILNLEKSEGKAVELGCAYMMSKPIFSVGKRFNIFCTLGCELATVDDLLNELASYTIPQPA